ncbi:hypothetical protein [Paraglaciecola sp. 2405UD69-4]|uniref:hypothetical protein n=1 Tax=Paraglaciecola sp. 2405UD69-4 TaxID=3391836 RepID=UPI0039C922CC
MVGQSMSPTLENNDYVICGRWPGYRPVEGCLVVVAHPYYQVIVKRVQAIDELGRLKLSGDNLLSVDSQSMGWIDKECLVGRVVFRISA